MRVAYFLYRYAPNSHSRLFYREENMDVKETFRKAGKKITPAYITKVALLTGIAYLLYLFVKIKLPFMFPSFLEMQFSELPAILAGFSLGPAAGVIVVILKCLLKFPFSSTIYVGEWTDMVLGVMYVLPASIIYALHKNKKNAIIGLAVGTFTSVIAAMILNRFVSVPFFVELYFEGDFAGIVGFLSVLYPKLTEENFYPIYLFAGVLPFNLIRLALMSLLRFFFSWIRRSISDTVFLFCLVKAFGMKRVLKWSAFFLRYPTDL